MKTARSGFTETVKIVGMAEGMGVDVFYVGHQIDTQVGTVTSAVLGAALAHTAQRAGELSDFSSMADDLLTEPLVSADGRIRIPVAAGAGTSVDEHKFRKYRTDR